MKRRIAAHFLLAWLSLAVMVPVMAVSPASAVGDMLFKSGLSYTPLEGRSDTWYLTYTGLNNLDEIVVYVWARKTEYITLFTTVFSCSAPMKMRKRAIGIAKAGMGFPAFIIPPFSDCLKALYSCF